MELCRRDTFPAIALSTAYLVDVLKVNPEESVVVCPVDHYVEDEYFEALKDLAKQADKDDNGNIKPFVQKLEQQVMFTKKILGQLSCTGCGGYQPYHQGGAESWQEHELSQPQKP